MPLVDVVGSLLLAAFLLAEDLLAAPVTVAVELDPAEPDETPPDPDPAVELVLVSTYTSVSGTWRHSLMGLS